LYLSFSVILLGTSSHNLNSIHVILLLKKGPCYRTATEIQFTIFTQSHNSILIWASSIQFKPAQHIFLILLMVWYLRFSRWCCLKIQVFWHVIVSNGKKLLTSSWTAGHWGWRHCNPLKHQQLFTSQQSVSSQNIFIPGKFWNAITIFHREEFDVTLHFLCN